MDNDSDTDKNSKAEAPWYRRPILVFAGFVVVAWIATFLVSFFWNDTDARGTFGDLFGAVNALFSGLAFVGLIYAILLQRQELELQRKELKDTREELKGSRIAQETQNAFIARQIFEATFFQLLRNLNDIIQSIDLRVDGSQTAVGRDAIDAYYRRLDREMLRHRDQMSGLIPLQNAIDAYEAFYKDSSHDLGHYFRTLYNVVKFVDQSESDNKRFYAQLVRAQLSDTEANLQFYNSLTPRAEKMRALVEKYHLLKYVDEARLFGTSHRTFYADAAFVDDPPLR